MHQLLAVTPIPTKPCIARGHPSCLRGFVRDRCRKCTLGSNACTMCHNHNPLSSPGPCVKNNDNRPELQQRLQRLSYDATSPPHSHITPPPRRSFESGSFSFSSESEKSSSSSKDSTPRQSLLIEEVKEREKDIKDTAEEGTTPAVSGGSSPFLPPPTTSSTPDSQKLSTSTATITTTTTLTQGSTSPLSPSSPGLPWTPPPSFSKSSGASASCIFCFNGRQVCEDCFGLGYVQRICQDCFKDQKNQQQHSSLQQPRRRHGASFSLPSVSRPSVPVLSSTPSPASPTTTTTPSSSASIASSLPWSGLGSRLKEQRWISGLSLSMGGLTSPSTESDTVSPTWTEVLSPVAKEAKSKLFDSSPSSSSDEQTPPRRQQQDRAGIVWAENVYDPPQTPHTPKWSASSLSSSPGMDAKNQSKGEKEDHDHDDDDDFDVDNMVFENKKPLPRFITTRATLSSSWSSSTPPFALSSSSFKTVVLKHLKVPTTLFKTGNETEVDSNNGVSSSNNNNNNGQESERRPDGDKRRRWSVGFANIGQSWIPSTRLGAFTAKEAGKQEQQEEGQEGSAEPILSSSGSSHIQEENRTKRGHRRYWSLSVMSPNNLFGATSTAA